MEKRKEMTTGRVAMYGVGGLGNNLCFVLISTYIMFFYTDVMGLPGVVAGTVFMVARLVDALTDPIMGIIIDRTNSKRLGKYRPYLIFAAPLMAILFVMLFTRPDMPVSGRIVYAFITYILYSLAWTAVQTPYLALPILFSSDVNKRTKFIAIIQSFSAVGAIVATSLAIPILKAFGGQYEPRAWTMLTLFLGILFVITTWMAAAAAKTVDRYQPPVQTAGQEAPRISLRQQFKAITKNLALLMIMLGFATDMLALQMNNALNIYFFQYNMGGRTDLMTTIGLSSVVTVVLVMFFMGKYVKTFGKRIGIIILEIGSILCALGVLLLPKTNVTAIIVVMVVATLFTSANNIATRAAVLDAANYAEWKMGIRANALVSSTFTFVNKLCQAIGAFILGLSLDGIGYVAQAATQTPATMDGILYLKTLVPIAAFAVTIIAMIFYPLKKKMEQEMSDALSTKHAENHLNEQAPEGMEI